ncbi:MAG: UDP-N-acetylmuramoyl-tripeptide--D-alanyl-D-alanine ligase [Coriobacteriales bacterium]|nr:UDP-N-acetylmuramoyl-tripeptide--D-alanyl-D-alanine ligase [Coriobacteriales bacterium]
MVRTTVHDLMDITNCTLEVGSQDCEIEGVCIDSRQVQKGSLFLAFKGETVDGNAYCIQAIKNGAAAVAMSREPSCDELEQAAALGATLVRTEDAQEFLEKLALWWREQLNCVVVGITGSSGKSTTKEMVARVLATELKTSATKGNLNSNIGAPLTVLACPLDAQALVVEMGMNGMHEIEAIARVAKPHIGVITNIGIAHIGLLGSRQNIALAKSELIRALPPSTPDSEYPSCAVLCGEDDFTGWISSEVAMPAGVRVITYGTEVKDDVSCPTFDSDEKGCAYGQVYLNDGKSFELNLKMPGVHNLKDALAAAAVGDLLGISPEHISEALGSLESHNTHQKILESAGGFTIIDDSYNANTDSMRFAIDVLCSLEGKRRIACLGDMGELGERAPLYHAVVGAYVAAKPIDILVCVGTLSREMAKAALLMGMPENSVIEVANAHDATTILRQLLSENDVVLIKASRSTGLDECVEAVKGL